MSYYWLLFGQEEEPPESPPVDPLDDPGGDSSGEPAGGGDGSVIRDLESTDSALNLLAAQFRSAKTTVEGALAIPRNIILALENEVDAIQRHHLYVADQVFDPLYTLPPIVVATVQGLETLMNCPFIRGTKWEYMIRGALDTGLGLHATVRDAIKDLILSASEAVFGSAVSEMGIMGLLFKLRNEYDKILISSGIRDAMWLMRDIIDCMNNLGVSVAKFVDEYDELREVLFLDGQGNIYENILEYIGFDEDKKEIILEQTGRIQEHWERIRDFDFIKQDL